MQQKHNSIQIIGGEWRGKKLQFVPIDNLRPTSGRVRETVFNWLANYSYDVVLDLYAGSGALGFEAISRNATQLTMVETNVHQVKKLQIHAQAVPQHLGKIQVFHMPAEQYLTKNIPSFDLVFLDPPFAMTDIAIQKLLLQLKEKTKLIYLERPTPLLAAEHPQFRLLKQKKIGQIWAQLLMPIRDGSTQ